MGEVSSQSQAVHPPWVVLGQEAQSPTTHGGTPCRRQQGSPCCPRDSKLGATAHSKGSQIKLLTGWFGRSAIQSLEGVRRSRSPQSGLWPAGGVHPPHPTRRPNDVGQGCRPTPPRNLPAALHQSPCLNPRLCPSRNYESPTAPTAPALPANDSVGAH